MTIPTVRLDARSVLARFSPAGIPEQVRNNLRRTMPSLALALGRRIEDKLNTELKSRKRLKVEKQLRENSTEVVAVVRTVWTGDSQKHFIPTILESGAKPHKIFPKTPGGMLAFFWEKMGRNVVLPYVNHPGFRGIFYTQRSLAEMESTITSRIKGAVTESVVKGKSVA